MTISNYTYFKDDVLQCMNTLIGTYKLDVYADAKSLWGLQVWLVNERCRIFLNAISLYPKPIVSFEFYIKEGDVQKEILNSYLYKYLGIEENEYYKYLVELTNTIEMKDAGDFCEYRKSLIVNEKMILKFYMPLTNKLNN